MSAGLLRSLVRSTSFTAASGPAARLQQPLVKRWKSGKTTSKSTAKATKKTAPTQTLSHLKTLEEEECGTAENPIFFKDPDRLKRMLSFNERNFTKDGFDEVTPIRHGLGDFRTPQPGPYPDNLPGSRPDDPQQEWDNSRASPEELRHLEYRYTIPNVETENFTFDRESGILQEADDEREFYQRVVLPKTKDLPFRSYADQQEEVDYEVSRDPVEWSYVERLLPTKGKIIKTDFEADKVYPSGFVPPNPATRQDESAEYYVGRTRNCMLPVYTVYSRLYDTVDTKLGKCEGNLYKLKEDIDAFLFQRYEQAFPSQVAELYGRIRYRGDFEQDIKEFLIAKGF